MPQKEEPYSFDLPGAVEWSGLGKDTLTRAIGTGALLARKSGINADGEPVGKYVIRRDDLKSYIDNLPAA